MIALVFDIDRHIRNRRHADGERSVAILAGEVALLAEFFMNPSG
jgi:hypothetical protein